ncbi:MAG: murein biosynthesis integral membrane protein MurJ [Candidatus Lambdaproteobacteria bacterium]|nr:murein biosynthesis integral membrane protein MurJ [Candidatus Lambdaproteobacteria bacterium]
MTSQDETPTPAPPLAPEVGAASGAMPSPEEAAAIYGRAGIVTFFTLLSRVLGMVRDLVISHRFGAGSDTDAWVQAFRIPNALRRLTAEGSMTIAFIPIYVAVRQDEGPAAAREFARRVLGLVLVLTGALCVLGMLFSPLIVRVVSPGFLDDALKFDLTASLIRWTFPYLVLVSAVAWAMGVLNAENRFMTPAAAPIFLNLGIIVFVLALASSLERPIMAVAWGVLAGGAAQVLLQLPALRCVGAAASPLLGWRDAHVRRLFGLLGPSLIGVAVYELNIIILGVIASYLPTGQIFHYNNATRVTELVMGLFAFSFTVAGFPTLSEHRAREDWGRMRETLALTTSAVMYTIFPAMAGLIAASTGIVSMLYLHGAYTLDDALTTADALRMMALGMPAVAVVRLLVPVFYAYGDARSPVLVSGLTVLVTGGLGWWLSLRYEVVGLSLGLSLGTWFQCALLAAMLRRHTRTLGAWFPWRALLIQALAAAAVGVLAGWGAGFGSWTLGPAAGLNWLVLGLVIGAAVAAYLGLTLALGEAQARHWVNLVNRLLRRIRRLGRRGAGRS